MPSMIGRASSEVACLQADAALCRKDPLDLVCRTVPCSAARGHNTCLSASDYHYLAWAHALRQSLHAVSVGNIAAAPHSPKPGPRFLIAEAPCCSAKHRNAYERVVAFGGCEGCLSVARGRPGRRLPGTPRHRDGDDEPCVGLNHVNCITLPL
jgi:hypothetical protein